MPGAGLTKTQHYSLEFTRTAARLSQLPDVEVAAVAAVASRASPHSFGRRTTSSQRDK